MHDCLKADPETHLELPLFRSSKTWCVFRGEGLPREASGVPCNGLWAHGTFLQSKVQFGSNRPRRPSVRKIPRLRVSTRNCMKRATQSSIWSAIKSSFWSSHLSKLTRHLPSRMRWLFLAHCCHLTYRWFSWKAVSEKQLLELWLEVDSLLVGWLLDEIQSTPKYS